MAVRSPGPVSCLVQLGYSAQGYAIYWDTYQHAVQYLPDVCGARVSPGSAHNLIWIALLHAICERPGLSGCELSYINCSCIMHDNSVLCI